VESPHDPLAPLVLVGWLLAGIGWWLVGWFFVGWLVVGGLPTKPQWVGTTLEDAAPFPTLSPEISHSPGQGLCS
jgi:hypothetical protein